MTGLSARAARPIHVRIGSLRRALGVPYPWSTAVVWPLRVLFPTPPRRGAFAALPPESPPAPLAPGGLSIVFLGDVMATTPDLRLAVHDELKRALSSADLVFLNCEAPVGETTRLHGLRFQLGGDVFARHVAALGIPIERLVVSLANNHVEDAGERALRETARRVEALGARACGLKETGSDLVAVAGLTPRVGFCAWTHWRNRPLTVPGTRPWTIEDVDAADWAAVRRDLALDVLVGCPHWDMEFRHTPAVATRALASRLLGRGFDLLFGHHPHVIQGIERPGEGLVCYSGGNAISTDSYYWPWAAKLGVALVVQIDPSRRPIGISYRTIPFVFRASRGRAELCSLPPADVAPSRERRRFDAVFPPAVPR
ncbi:MAG: CapA family protein [Candidatus Bipolaricaulota bacterium]